MSLKVCLRKNNLPACIQPFVVRSTLGDSLDFDRFVDGMVGRTTLTRTDIIAAMQLFSEELGRQLAEGKSVKTPVGSFYLCASGSMATPDEAFTPSDKSTNHELRIHFRPESGFEADVRDAVRVVRVDVPDQGAPRVRSAFSSDSSGPNVTRAGDIINVHGFSLKFDPANPQEGLFFIDSSGAETRSSLYGLVLPKSIVAGVPAGLVGGGYAIAVRSLSPGKLLREGRLEGITVAAA